jgi:hypothetical protein
MKSMVRRPPLRSPRGGGGSAAHALEDGAVSPPTGALPQVWRREYATQFPVPFDSAVISGTAVHRAAAGVPPAPETEPAPEVALDEFVIKFPSPLNVLKDTYDHSC